MRSFKKEKQFVLNYFRDMENASSDQVKEVMKKYVSEDYNFKGVYPFRHCFKSSDFIHAVATGHFYRRSKRDRQVYMGYEHGSFYGAL